MDMSNAEAFSWLDGRLVRASDRPSALADGVSGGCYTTARVEAGRVCLAERHSRRLRRDAERLGFDLPANSEIQRALRLLAQAAFPTSSGIIRLSAYPRSLAGGGAAGGEPDCRTLLIGEVRELGPEPATWSAVTWNEPHPGPEARHGAKVHLVDAYMQALLVILPLWFILERCSRRP